MSNIDTQSTTLNSLFNHIKYISNSDFDLEDIERKSTTFVDFITSDYITYPNSKEQIKSSIKRMRELTKILLTSIDKGFEKSLKKIDTIYSKIDEIQKFTETNPTFLSINDPIECKRFYKKLDKEEYTQVEVSELLGITRQTISNYFKSGKFGNFKTKGKNKITKEGLYIYFSTEFLKKKKK
jgi:predicted transcriptional regulator